MSSYCDKLQERIAQEGKEMLVRDQAAQDHVAGCDSCFAFLEALGAVESDLQNIPLHNAPEELLTRVREKVLSEAAVVEESAAARFRYSAAAAISTIRRFGQKISSLAEMNNILLRPGVRVALVVFFILGIAVYVRLSHLTRSGSSASFILIQGTFGALVMVVALVLAVISFFRASVEKTGYRRFAPAGVFLSVAMLAFVLRSMTSTFFGVDYKNEYLMDSPVMNYNSALPQKQYAGESSPSFPAPASKPSGNEEVSAGSSKGNYHTRATGGGFNYDDADIPLSNGSNVGKTGMKTRDIPKILLKKGTHPAGEGQDGRSAGADEGYADLVTAFRQDLDSGKKKLDSTETELREAKKELSDYKERSTKVLETVVDKYEQLSREVDSLAGAVRQDSQDTPMPVAKEPEGEDNLESLFPEPPLTTPPPPLEQEQSTVNSLLQNMKESLQAQTQPSADRGKTTDPARSAKPGDSRDGRKDQKSITVALLTGVSAPVDGIPVAVLAGKSEAQLPGFSNLPQGSTDESTLAEKAKDMPVGLISPGDSAQVELLTDINLPIPAFSYPVALKINGPILGRYGRQTEYQDAKLLGEAFGPDPAEEKLMIRLSKLIFTRPDGGQTILDVNGWITAPGGDRQIPGTKTGNISRAAVQSAAMNTLQLLDPAHKNRELAESVRQISEGNAGDDAIRGLAVSAGSRLQAVFSTRAEVLARYREDLEQAEKAGWKLTQNSARQFVDAQRMLDGLTFKEAAGYWANTYVPGDAGLRKLHTDLLTRDRSYVEASVAKPLKLHQAVRQNSQPFDEPRDASLAVYLHADRRGIQDRSRMLVQVGIKGINRSSGSRPAMNIGMVLDLRGTLPEESAARIRELVFGLNKAKDIGDRFYLIAAGKPAAAVVEPQNFTHGYLTVSLPPLFKDNQDTAPKLSLAEAAALAVSKVRETDNPNAPLGSSEVILVTSQGLSSELSALEALAHESAVSGIPLSVIGVGKEADLEQLNRISLAGQGTRRVLGEGKDAAALIRRELSAVSRIVARAVRLRIRLAPGVKLVDMIGSYRLDQNRAEQVRQAEKSIDRRIAKNLGIEADRGEDEEGMQIVIPAFYAGDAHVILLDVVAPGPGPIADVRARYKDLVFLKNGVSSSTLSLDRSEVLPGPLEQNVLKNLLALRLSTTLETVAAAVATGHEVRAAQITKDYQNLLLGMREYQATFLRDLDIKNDIDVLGEYLEVINAHATQPVAQREYLADSLNLASKLKVLPKPPED